MAKKLTEEEQEDLLAILHHRGIKHLLSMLDDSVELMRNDILTVPLPSDPQSAAIAVYGKRLMADGAVALKTALNSKINAIMLAYKEGQKK